MSYSESYDPAGGIAIVGMAGRFPGARNVWEFWRNLEAGVESISFFSEEEIESSLLETPSIRADPQYVKARGILEGAETFDAAFFGINPREAELLDPQQRIFLETAWETLEDAGYDPQAYQGAIGLFAGMTNNTYFPALVASRRGGMGAANALQTMMGNEKDYLTTRASYKLNLRGPSLNIQTACSTSLVAVCQAFHSLMSYQCDLALAGGVSVASPQRRGYLYYEGAIVSPDGHCRAFDVNSQGTVFSNGVGVVALKRLTDALADGDQIYAVIKGVGINNDGAERVSFAAPSVGGQAEAIAMAQALAGIEPETISYIEAHGTGTALGDPIEVAALTQAFRLRTDKCGFCGIGSVKTNIGHLDVAAGVAGLIKTVLALKHRKLPASLHFTQPNPKIDFANSPFYVNATLKEWEAHNTPLRAGVSSFGTGGTNAHVVLEEAPPREASGNARLEQVIVLSAKSESALERATENLVRHLQGHPEANLADVAYTLQTGRRVFNCRRMVVAHHSSEVVERLTARNAKHVVTKHCDAKQSGVAFLFPGQGAQYVNMGRQLFAEGALFADQVSACAQVLAPRLGVDLRSVLYPEAAQLTRMQELITQTRVTQPALFVVEYALAQMWRQWGFRPKAMIGHSLGEYVAACVSGVLSRNDALVLIAGRARLMQALPPGAMLAVRLPATEVEPRLNRGLSIAAINGVSLTVVSGPIPEVEAFQQSLNTDKIASRKLLTSHAFHSPMMDPILKQFAELFKGVKLNAPEIPWVSCLTGQWITPEQATDPDYWTQQLRQPVRFVDGLRTLFQDPQLTLLEVGPGQTLGTLAKQHPDKPAGQEMVSSLPAEKEAGNDVEYLCHALGQLWLAGATVDWTGVHNQAPRQRVSLPTYPFERKRFWISLSREAVPDPVTRTQPQQTTPVTVEPQVSVPSFLDHKDTTMSEAVNGAVSDAGVRPDLSSKLQNLFSEISGVDVAEISTGAPFLEIGLDSLLLTQASTEIQKQFGVKIAFRQLLEELSTIDALAAYLAEFVPAEKPAATIPVPVVAQSTAVPRESPSGVRPNDLIAQNGLPTTPVESPVALPGDYENAGTLERILSKQLEIMARQLDMLQGGRSAVATSRVKEAHSPQSHPQPQAAVTAPSVSNGAAAPHREQDKALPQLTTNQGQKAFGPYRPIQKGERGGLTTQQQQYLDTFIARYTARTKESKRLTALHRLHLADPRSVAGFRLLWKEIVYPIVTNRSRGSKLWDVDGNEYVDLTNGFGAILFGHAPTFVTEAVEAQLKLGMEIGPQSPLAGQVAELLCRMTGMERATFCNTGSEAVLAAMRISRTVTGRDKIVSFAGDYHGIFDEVLVRPATIKGELRSRPIAPGIPTNTTDNVIVLDYGTPASLDWLRSHAGECAAVLVEPVQSRRLELQPKEFLQEIRKLTAQSGTAFICDEIVTGFRVHPGGAQALFGFQADIATYGKVIGGGVPIGVVAGKAQYMDALDGGAWQYGDGSGPEVGVTFFAGTFVRHPLALAAAWACLNHLQEHSPELQRRLNQRTSQLVETLRAHAERVGAPIRLTHFSSLFWINFPADFQYANLFFAHMREKGIHMWDGRVGVLTTVHSDEDLERMVNAYKATIIEMQAAGFLAGSSHDQPPVPGARLGKDSRGNSAWFIPDPERPGKYLQVGESQ